MPTLLTESLWGDEGFSALAVKEPFLEMLGIVMRDTAPPLFYIVGFTWVNIFGSSEVALRSLSLLLMLGAATFSALTVYHLEKKRFLAILTGLFAFFSPFLIPFAFEWRMYALLTFTIMGSIYFFTSKKWGWYVVFATAALYTHHFAIFTLAGQGIWFVIDFISQKKSKSFKSFLKSLWPFYLIIAFYSLWLYPMYLQVTRVQGSGFWLVAPKFSEVTNLLYRFITSGVKQSFRIWIAIAVGIVLIFKNWQKYWRIWLGLFFIIILPVILSALVSHIVTPIFYDRYLLSVVMGFSILIVLGSKKYALPILTIIAAIYISQSYQVFTNPQKRPFKQLASYLKQEIKQEDFLINFNGKAHHIWESKYYGVPAPIYTPDGPLPLYVGTAQMKPTDTIDIIPDVNGRLAVITSEPKENVNLPDYWKFLEEKDFSSIRVIWYIQ